MEFRQEPGRIWAEDQDGKLLAEILFPSREGKASITRTFVDDSLRGQGVAGQLMEAAVEKLRADNMEVRPICSYAKTWFEKHPEEADLLKK